jgi:glycosyltransferase involved in cell wall biosynthesis
VANPIFQQNEKISVVVPAYNEQESLEVLSNEVAVACKKLHKQYEIIFVNDGSTDQTQKVIERLHERNPTVVKGIQLNANYGKAAALHAGFQAANYDYVLTLDADLQDDPSEMSKLFDKIHEGYDAVSGWKQKRKDSFIKNKTSKLYNAATNLVSGTSLHDHNSGYKLYRSVVIKSLNIYGEMHRYIPALLAAQGHTIAEVPVAHRKRVHGKSKYGPIRFINGALDLITVLFLTRFRYRPLHFFGYVGLTSFSIGFIIAFSLTIYKVFAHKMIGDRPLLQLAILLIIVGVQITITGVVAELLTATSHERRPAYKIKSTLGQIVS